MKSNYIDRKQARIERFSNLASKAEANSEKAFQNSHNIASYIPMGQPILVGHHSEARHRRDANRIENGMRKGVEESKKADYYSQKAEAAEKNNCISSDNPQAITKLKIKLESLEKAHNTMKEANKIVKNWRFSDQGKIEEIVKLGISEKNAQELLKPDFCNRIGFASYALQNNNANISRIKKRIEELEKVETLQTSEEEIKGVRIVDNVEENRLQLFFADIPTEQVRTELKQNGFRWSGFNKCWQRFRSEHASYVAKRIISNFV